MLYLMGNVKNKFLLEEKMKKYFVILLMLLAFQICFSQTYYVDPTDPLNYNSIHSAVDAAIGNGGTGLVIVCNPNTNGTSYTYNENIIINFQHNEEFMSLSLIKNTAIGQGEVIIHSPVLTSHVIDITGRNNDELYLLIDGFTICNGLCGINLTDMYLYSAYINNCVIAENVGGIFADDTMPNIENCTITYNIASGMSESWNSAVQREIAYVKNSEISHNGHNGLNLETCWDIENCTIVFNGETGLEGYRWFNVTSSIIRDNTLQIELNDYYEVKYSNIEGGYIGTGNIDADPLFTDPGNGIYSLQWNDQHISPCIDSGDPTILDPDETPSDMGAYRAEDHDYHLTTAEHNRYRYSSFPVIDRVYVQQGFETTYICAPVEEQTDYFRIFDQEGHYQEWEYENGWNSNQPLITLNSREGYKLKTISDVEIPTSGITLPENTRVYLDAGENWVGYFIEESMTLQDAFAEIWDHVTAVYSEDWAWERPGIPNTRSTLLYGKMYIVHVDEACDFVYGNGVPVDPKERGMTEGFYYVETPTYSPINILNLDDPTVLEVGVFIDGECIGATQMEEFPLQILAFPPEGGRGSGDITFEFYCGGRNYKSAQNYKVLNKETGQYDNSQIELRPYEFTSICFGNPVTPISFTLSGNYPNPFNPTTTINYSIPSDGNVKLAIYNIKGQKVKTLVTGTQSAGSYNVTWDGKDENDRPVSSGMYFYKLRSSGKTAVKKMLMLK